MQHWRGAGRGAWSTLQPRGSLLGRKLGRRPPSRMQLGPGSGGSDDEPESASQIFVGDDRAPVGPPIAHGAFA